MFGIALSCIFALVACVLSLGLASISIEIDETSQHWWFPVFIVHVGGFSVIAVLVTASLVMLKGWP